MKVEIMPAMFKSNTKGKINCSKAKCFADGTQSDKWSNYSFKEKTILNEILLNCYLIVT